MNAVAQFTLVAQYQARVAVADMSAGRAGADYSVLPTAIFTDPELGGVGLTEEQAREQGHDVGVAATSTSSAPVRAPSTGCSRSS